MQNGFITISSQNLFLDCLLLWVAKCITKTHLSCFIMWDKTCHDCTLSIPPPQSNAEIIYIMSSLKSGASLFTHLSIGWSIEEGRRRTCFGPRRVFLTETGNSFSWTLSRDCAPRLKERAALLYRWHRSSEEGHLEGAFCHSWQQELLLPGRIFHNCLALDFAVLPLF